MWISKLSVCSTLAWALLALLLHPGSGLLQHTADELVCLRRLCCSSTRTSLSCLAGDISTGAVAGPSTSTTPKPYDRFGPPPAALAGRTADHSVLASLARSSARASVSQDTAVNFGLLNIRSLTSKGHLIQDLLTDRKLHFLCLTETWQQPGDFSQLNDSAPPGLFTSRSHAAPVAAEVSR